MTTTVYYHDYAEVDPTISWTGLCAPLANAEYLDIRECQVPAVSRLFEYTRPDIVIAINGHPVLSLEQTRMNPSGHNIPQRFSSGVKAAELGIPSIMYYPAYARRTLSDPNVRYLNIRVLLAQFRMSQIYQVPSLSIFWPTDDTTLLPTNGQAEQVQMADTTAALINNAGRRRQLLRLPEVTGAQQDMRDLARDRARWFRRNPSVRAHFPDGLRTCSDTGLVIDPPQGLQLIETPEFLTQLSNSYPQVVDMQSWDEGRNFIASRDFTLLFTGTSNKHGTDSEHPWPGHLTMLDLMYARQDGARFHHMRDFNLVYRLPVDADLFLERLNRASPPTAAYIVDVFSDLLLLDNGLVSGRPIRGAAPAEIGRR